MSKSLGEICSFLMVATDAKFMSECTSDVTSAKTLVCHS